MAEIAKFNACQISRYTLYRWKLKK